MKFEKDLVTLTRAEIEKLVQEKMLAHNNLVDQIAELTNLKNELRGQFNMLQDILQDMSKDEVSEEKPKETKPKK